MNDLNSRMLEQLEHQWNSFRLDEAKRSVNSLLALGITLQQQKETNLRLLDRGVFSSEVVTLYDLAMAELRTTKDMISNQDNTTDAKSNCSKPTDEES
jgi:hypothetical protein